MKRKVAAPTKRKVSDPSRAKPTTGLLEYLDFKWDPPLFAFDYTADQWARIRAALSTRATPGFYSLERECKDLRVIACCYRIRAANHEGESQRREYLNQQWLTIAEAAITIVDNIDVSNVPSEEVLDREACWKQATAILRIARKHLRGDLDVDPLRLLRHGRLPAKAIQIRQLVGICKEIEEQEGRAAFNDAMVRMRPELPTISKDGKLELPTINKDGKLEEHLGVPAEGRLCGNLDVSPLGAMPPAEYAQALVRHLTGRRRGKALAPKEQYLFEVLDVWCGCGGKDTITSRPDVDRGRRVTGSLAEFFDAVTGPVCGGSTDSLSGKRGILERYKKHKKRRELGWP